VLNRLGASDGERRVAIIFDIEPFGKAEDRAFGSIQSIAIPPEEVINHHKSRHGALSLEEIP